MSKIISVNPVSSLPIPNLAERVKAIQAAKRDLGVQNEAASSIPKAITHGVAFEGSRWVMRELVIPELNSILSLATHKPMTRAKFLSYNETDIFSQFRDLWDQDLLAPDHMIRYEAVKKLTGAILEEPQRFVQQVERLLRDILVTSQEVSNHKDRYLLMPAKRVIRGLLSMLEALYQINDDRIQLDSKMSHGWQEPNPAISKIHEQWYPEKPVSDYEGDSLDIPILVSGKGWYDQNSVGEVLSNLVRYSHCFPLIDETSLEITRRILVRNWKVDTSYKIPSTDIFEATRFGMYKTMLRTIVDEDGILTSEDPLFLRTPFTKVPTHLQKCVAKFREQLVVHYVFEKGLKFSNQYNFSPSVVKTMELIFKLADESFRKAIETEEQYPYRSDSQSKWEKINEVLTE